MTSPMPNCYRLWLCMPAPSLCVANEEQLLVGVALKAGQPLLLVAQFGQMILVGGKCLFDAPIVGNVLALGEDAVDAQVGIGHFTGGVLVNDALLQQQEMGIGGTFPRLACLPLNKSFLGAWVPPILQIADPIKLRTLVIEAMRDLVPNNCPDAPVIDGLGEGLIKEGRLQNGSREC